MMIHIVSALVAFFVAGTVTYLDYRNSNYPRTAFLLRKSRALWSYVLMYALTGFCLCYFWDNILQFCSIKIDGIGLNNPWWKAMVIGFSAKGLSQLTLVNISKNSQTVPIGPSTILQLFEPGILHEIMSQVDNAQKTYLGSFVEKYPDLSIVKDRIARGIPLRLSKNERDALEVGVERSESILEAMSIALDQLGRETFERIFPYQ